MSIQVICPSCDRKIKAGISHAGKQVNCPACTVAFVIPPIAALASSGSTSRPASDDAPVANTPANDAAASAYGAMEFIEFISNHPGLSPIAEFPASAVEGETPLWHASMPGGTALVYEGFLAFLTSERVVAGEGLAYKRSVHTFFDVAMDQFNISPFLSLGKLGKRVIMGPEDDAAKFQALVQNPSSILLPFSRLIAVERKRNLWKVGHYFKIKMVGKTFCICQDSMGALHASLRQNLSDSAALITGRWQQRAYDALLRGVQPGKVRC